MKNLVFKKEKEHFHYWDDVRKIVKVFDAKGYRIAEEDARAAWEKYSETMCAGWLILPEKNEDIFNAIIEYFDEWRGQ